ncbi:MAG TPA: carboxy terminal-processing peptidase [Verrucomicrobiae bacterium]|nr:carboxy terminal-processing peptidase [Verrucomicrobiae bacterium]
MRFRFLFAARCLASALVLLHVLPKAHGAPPPEPRTVAEMAAAADPNDAIVAQIAAANLQHYHYTQRPFDEEMSSRFLDRFLDSLDYLHMFFLQSDIAEFEQYRTKLNVMTLEDTNISPCWVIFSRFMDRVHQRVDFASNQLQTATFDFKGHEKFVLNRHTLPYAKDLDEAKESWRQALRCEYLDQLLTSPDIQFTGPVSFDAKGNAVVTLTRDKMHPLSFDYLTEKYMAKDGHAIGWLEVAANQSNATLRLELASHENLRKTTNQLYSAKGEELGDVTFRREKVDTDSARNTDAPAPDGQQVKDGQKVPEVHPGGNNNDATAAAPRAAATTNLEAVIRLNQKNMAEIHKTMTNHYASMLRNYKELDPDRAFELYVNSLARAYDPHSDFMGHISAENFNIQMKLSLIGIGALLGKDDDYCTIEELKEGPAKKSGKLHEKDRIVAVAQSNAPPVDVEGMPLDKIVEMIRGSKGTQVTLTVVPHDAPDSSVRKNITLIRDEIKLEDMDAWARLYESPEPSVTARATIEPTAPFHANPANPDASPSTRLGVINIQSFYGDNESSTGSDDGSKPPKSMTTDVSNLVARLKKENVGGIILDLRHNGGGYLEEAISLTGLFVPPGPVVQTKDPNGVVDIESCRRTPVLYDGPLIVLTSRFSASASEILAGALQDYNRALIVGDHSTFGKGTVQTMQSLKPNLVRYLQHRHMDYDPNYDPGALKLTIKKFYRAGGVSTQFNGVASDIELPSIWNYDTDEVGESALPYALPCDEVDSANPAFLNRVKPYLAELQQRSRNRVAASKDFAYIQEDVTEFLKQKADKSLSLNLAERQAEQKTKLARYEAIKKERLSRGKTDEKVFEITLRNVDLPQLQPPPVKSNTVAVVDQPAVGDDSDNDPDVEASAAESVIDPTLEEAKHILADYIALVNKQPGLSKVP